MKENKTIRITLWLTPEENGRQLVSGQNCTPQLAAQEFRATRDACRKDSPVWFYHYVQSFHPKYQFLDKKRAEGKPYFVYMTAAQNKFLRIYYARVKECLTAFDALQDSEN